MYVDKRTSFTFYPRALISFFKQVKNNTEAEQGRHASSRYKEFWQIGKIEIGDFALLGVLRCVACESSSGSAW